MTYRVRLVLWQAIVLVGLAVIVVGASIGNGVMVIGGVAGVAIGLVVTQ